MLTGSQPGAPDGVNALKKAMAQSPNTVKVGADEMLPVSVVRELANGSPADRARLRQMVSELSPRGQTNLMHSIVHGTRDPRSPANNVSVTPEGQMMLDVVFNGVEPDADYLARIGMGPRLDAGDPVPVDNLLQEPEDLVEKSAPDAPKTDNKRELKREPAFRSREGVQQREDGSFRVTHDDVSLDAQTRRAIDRANEGQPVGPIYDDAANTPPGKPAGRALASGTRSPHQAQTQLVQRLAEIRDPHGGALGDSMSIEAMEDLAITGDVPHSVFASNGQRNVQGRSVATVRPQDHADAMQAWQAVRRGSLSRPNQQYASAEEMARDLMSNISQEGFNVTPVTARQRRAVTNHVSGYPESDDVEAIVERAIRDEPTPASVGREARSQFPEAVSATKTAERAVMQEQAIATLARKLDAIFGHEGWGENYKPTIQPATDAPAAPPRGAGDGVETSKTLDPGMSRGEYEPTRPRRVSPDSPGTDIDPEITPEELAERAALLEGDGPELPVGEEQHYLLPGRAHGDKASVTPSKPREEGGNKTGEYQDPDQSFAEYNRRNVMLSDSDAARRQRFFDEWQRTMELDPGRSSLIRQELDALEMDESPMTPERAARMEELHSRLRMAERLDQMSGIRSFALGRGPKPRGKTTPKPKASKGELIVPPQSAHRTVDAEFDLDGKPHTRPDEDIIDAEFELVPTRQPDAPVPEKVPDPSPAPKKGWSRWAKVAAGLAGGVGIYNLLRNAGQPPINPPLPPAPPGSDGGGGIDLPPGGPDGFPPFAADSPDPMGEASAQEMTTADRIRKLRMMRGDYGLRLNPNTQTLQNWTY